jgi:crossover junction endodeoxyribonuclease RuvC
MIVLGLDIGYDRCGFALFDFEKEQLVYSGVILTDKSLDIQTRLKELRKDLAFIKKKYKPEAISIEKLFFNRKNTVFEKICMSKGVAFELFSDLRIIEVEPNKAKKDILGNGSLKKSEIRPIVEKIMKMDFKGFIDDEVDAIFLALYLIQFLKLEKMYNR